MMCLGTNIRGLLDELDALLVCHFYQKDDIVQIADVTGDSLELSKKASASSRSLIVFCGVAFMGQSVKILSPHKRVIMPKVACCSMARMISSDYFDASIAYLEGLGLGRGDIFPMTYINSNADVKAKVGEMGGVVCTSSNAKRIFEYAEQQHKKIFFLPDRCLGVNMSKINGKKCSVIGVDSDKEVIESDVICYNGFCSVHQLFEPSDVDFFRSKYKDVLIVAHPECRPEVVERSDFVGSTSQIIDFVRSLPPTQVVAVGTEFNLVNRLRKPFNGRNYTFVLSSSKPQCPTMNETSLRDIENVLLEFKHSKARIPNEIELDVEVIQNAQSALFKMMELS